MPSVQVDPPQKEVGNHPCPHCGIDRYCQFRYREQWCKKCGYIKTGKKRDTRKEKFCLSCGKRILVPSSLMNRKKYCSTKCRNLSYIGRNLTEEHKKKIGTKLTGHKTSYTTRKKISVGLQKISESKWYGFVLTQNHLDRKMFLRVTKKEVLKRDGYTCRICGKRGGLLHVDHIQKFSEHIELRFCLENCRTLCQSCHYFVTFGRAIPESSNKWGVKTYA